MATAVLGAAVLIGCAAGGAGWTQASWTVGEAGTGTFTARVVSYPTISGCTYNAGVLGLLLPSITIVWKFDPASGYTAPPNVLYYAGASAVPGLVNLGSSLSTSNSGGTYSTTFQSTVLLGILGGSYVLGIRSVEPANGWTSKFSSGSVALPGGVCTISNGQAV